MEGKYIQKHPQPSLYSTSQAEPPEIAKGFNGLMLQGKVHQAASLISNANRRGLLNLDSLIPTSEDNEGNMQWKTSRDILLKKHPQQQMPSTEVLLHDNDLNQSQYDPVMFERITGDLIKEAATKIQRSAGPSGVDVHL